MISRRSPCAWPALALMGSVIVATGCFLRHNDEAAPLQPRAPIQQIDAPSRTPTQSSPLVNMSEEFPEPYIENLVAVDADVRLVLQRIAEMGNLELVIPGNVKKTISVRYIHVPVSVALKDVLARSGLRLGTGTSGPLPFDTVTVFYRLPANIDSLSVDAIMKKFGVSRPIAELIVSSRPPER